MAKKVVPPEENQELQPELETTGKQEDKQNSDPVQPIEKPKNPTATKGQIPANVSAVLRLHKGYKKLYVDSHGGAFTEDTPENIRGNSTLYDNPFYEPKTK